jgi:hypothetical protein
MNRLRLTLPLALALVGCQILDRNNDGNSDPNEVGGVTNVAVEAPASPTFVIMGTLRDPTTQLPIANQRVAITLGGNTNVTGSVATDANGAFSLAGAQIMSNLYLAIEGYQTVNVPLFDFIDWWGADVFDPNTPSNNRVFNLGDVFLAPATSSMSFTIVRSDGVPVANTPIMIDLPTVAVFDDAFGRETRYLTTDANGVATLTDVPDPATAQRLVNNGFYAYVVAPPVDINDDGVYDYAGQANSIYYNVIGEKGGKVVGAILPATSPFFDLVASNTSKNLGGRNPPVPPSSPLRFVFNQEVDPASVTIVVMSDFPHRRSDGKVVYDDSTAEFADETFPEPAFGGRSTNVLSASANELRVTLDPSGTIVTATPSRGFAAGRLYIVSIAATAASASSQSGGKLQQRRTFATDPSGGLAVESVFLERSGVSNTYANVVVELNQAIRGVQGPFSSVGRLYGCIDSDLNNDGDRTGPGGATLDKGECPAAGGTVTQSDVETSLVVLVARGAEGTNGNAGFSRYFDLDLGQANLADAVGLAGGVSTLPLKIFINGIVSGKPNSASPSTASVDANWKVLPTQVLDATIDTTGASTRLSRPPVGGGALLVRSGALPATTLAVAYGETNCNDGVDNDLDGTFDCDAVNPDNDCASFCDAPAVTCNGGQTALVHQLVENETVAPRIQVTFQSRPIPVVPGTLLGQSRFRYTIRSLGSQWIALVYSPNYNASVYLNYFGFGTAQPNFVNTSLYNGAATNIYNAPGERTGAFSPFYGSTVAFTNQSASGPFPVAIYNYYQDFPVMVDSVDLFTCVQL